MIVDRDLTKLRSVELTVQVRMRCLNAIVSLTAIALISGRA